jgi:hypothetical protein
MQRRLKVGEFTKKPVCTMFGLHVKLTDRKPRLNLSSIHILIQDKWDSLVRYDSVQTSGLAQDIYRVKNEKISNTGSSVFRGLQQKILEAI